MREITGCPGYFINEDGQVFSKRAAGRKYRDKVNKTLRPRPDKNGYLCVFVYADKKRTLKIHRVVAEAFVPNPKGLPLVRHINDIKTDNRASNLAWGTPADNARDMKRNGISTSGNWDRSGENNPNCKLTASQVAEIRRTYVKKYGALTRLAKQYGVSANLIGEIVAGRCWKGLK